ncbi:MAG TPA: aminotransferase class III-fold pyridoxal phosphate-dependent enzyme, partial [Terriglobales bacterium]|nr:aminotransferase class III-fold pyridoxal phosphate-dependent enzyme [Terriglobales bacterium]
AFAREVLAFAGENFRGGCVYFTCGGSEAVETALKLARQYQVEVAESSRYQVLGRRHAYHGATLGAVGVSGNLRRRQIYLPMVREHERVATPYCYRCSYKCKDCATQYAFELERILEKHAADVAGFIFEPMSGATLGAAAPPEGYLSRIAETCRKHEVLLIADEVMTGFGRTGKNFAVEHWGIAPDIIVAAKGIASGYAPLGALIASARVVDAIAKGSGSFTHGFTYNAHPVAIAAGSAVLERVKAQDLVAAAGSQTGVAGAAFREALATLRQLPSVGDVRGLGLLWAVEFVRDKASKHPFAPDLNFAGKVFDAARSRGVLVYPMQGCVDGYQGDHLLLAPPAVTAPEDLRWAVGELASSIQECADSLH